MTGTSAAGMAGGLWAHQTDAVRASAAALAGGGRTTVISACGTGKTRIASAVVNQLARDGRNLVTVPTLELAAQTVREWREAGDGPLGTVVVVCSDPAVLSGRGIDLGGGVTVTTSAEQIAAAAAVPGRVTVLSTLDSVPTVAAAHTRHHLPKWDFVVVDEAHRTVGAPGARWTAVHDDHLVPAARRLYMTATPRVSGGTDAQTIAMDDEAVFGRVCYRLSFGRAIGLGLLADYRLVVPVITDDQVRALTADETSPHLQLGRAALAPAALAAQIAVLRAMGEYRIRRAISYHPRITDAHAWSITLPHTTELVPDGPARVWAAHLEGAHTGQERRRVLDRLGAGGDEVCLVANARVLAEGVDVPAVDGVVFTTARDSPVDTVQAVGRALRTGGVKSKIASIVIPLLIGPGQDPDQAAAASDWAPVWRVIRALCDHDERLETSLRRQRRALGAQTGGAQTGDAARGLPGWFHVRGIPVSDRFAAAITVRAIRATVPKWEEYYGACEAFYNKYGHLDIPRHHRIGELNVGEFISSMRTYKRRGMLSREREELLNRIGMIYNAQDARWERNYALARAYHKEYGHLLIPDTYQVAGADGTVHKPGQWIDVQRQRGTQGLLRADRRKKLDAIGMIWEVRYYLWERGFTEAENYVKTNDRLDCTRDYVTPSGYRLGRWLENQLTQKRANRLPRDRENRLRGLDAQWAEH